jgi:hypothetical protein
MASDHSRASHGLVEELCRRNPTTIDSQLPIRRSAFALTLRAFVVALKPESALGWGDEGHGIIVPVAER